MSKQTGPFLKLEKVALEMARTKKEKRVAIDALQAKIAKYYSADEVRETRDLVIEDMDMEIRDTMEELDGWDDLRQEAIGEMEDLILPKVAERLEWWAEEVKNDNP
jgi:hypothetical protein